MATGYFFKVLFFIQSAAFILFIIEYTQMSPVLLTAVGKLITQTHCDFNRTVSGEVIIKPSCVRGNESLALPSRGLLSNCTLADIEKRPGVVMLTTANLAYADVTLNMLASVKRVGVCVNTTIIAEDQKAYELLLKHADGDPAVFVQKTNSGEMDGINRRAIMNKRQAYILTLLEQGREILFADSDTFWFRDPFPYFQGDFDISLRSWDKERRVSKSNFCAGFIYLKPTKATTQFVRAWAQAMDDYNQQGKFPLDQNVMNGLLRKDKPEHVDIKILDEDLFPWGPLFFNPSWQKQNHSTVVMHAASIRSHQAKRKKFMEFGMWLVNVTTSSNS